MNYNYFTRINVELTDEEIKAMELVQELCQKVGIEARDKQENFVYVNDKEVNQNTFFCVGLDLEEILEATK